MATGARGGSDVDAPQISIAGSVTEASATTELAAVLASKNTNERDLRESLRRVRILIAVGALRRSSKTLVATGTHIDINTTTKTQNTLRGHTWKALLNIHRVSALDYTKLVNRGPSPVFDKIQNDVFRTLATDTVFRRRVSHDMLTRVLNAFVWRALDQPPSRLLNLTFSYVQGMNVLCAPFLFVLPELDAFCAFHAFVHHACPLYVQPALEGVHCGVKLLEKCIEEIDPELSMHLKSKDCVATLYAFPSVMTLSACTPPLDQALHLWDFYLAFGTHLNILCILAQMLNIRQELMDSQQPMRLLRAFPNLNADTIITTTRSLIPKLSEDLYDLLARHTFDPAVCDMLLQETVEQGHEL